MFVGLQMTRLLTDISFAARADTANAQDGDLLPITLKCVGVAALQAVDALVGINGEEWPGRLLLQFVKPEVSFVVSAHEDDVRLDLLQCGSGGGIVMREVVQKAEFFRIVPGMVKRRQIERTFVGECSQVARLQDQVDALSRFFFPTSTQLEAEFNIAVKIGKDGNVYA